MCFTYSERGLTYSGDEEHVVIPEIVDGMTVRYLEPACFQYQALKSVVLPITLVEISANAFQGCRSLTSIEIPSSVTHIAGGAFQGCQQLEQITIPASVIDIGSYAFDECFALQHVLFEGSLDYIGAYAFSDTALQHVDIPNGIVQLGNSIFFNCQQLTSVTLPSTIEVIGTCAFAGCIRLHTLTLPANVKAVMDGAFEYCQQLQDVTFESIPTFIDACAFADCPVIQRVQAPLNETDMIELYNEQRYLYQSSPQLMNYVGQYVPFRSLFMANEPITFSSISGPDYRITHTSFNEQLVSAQALFEEELYEEVLALLKNNEERQVQRLIAQCYVKLQQTPKALQTYRQLAYDDSLVDEDYAQIGQLLVQQTSLTSLSSNDAVIIGKHYIASFM